MNPNNGRLEWLIKERKEQVGLGLQPDIYIDTSLGIITGEIIDYCNSLKKKSTVKKWKSQQDLDTSDYLVC